MKKSRLKKEDHPLVKITDQIMKVGITWIAKIELRCALEGCRYGNEVLDKEPLDKCMYCGASNPSYNFWNLEKSKK